MITVAESCVVAGGRVAAGIARHQLVAIQKVSVLIDTQADIAADQTIVRRVGVRAGIGQAAAEGANAGRLATVHQVEADTVCAVAAGTAGVTAVGRGGERYVQALAGRKGEVGDDRAILVVAAGAAVGEAQRTAAYRIGQQAAVAANLLFSPEVAQTDARRNVAGVVARGQAGAVKGLPVESRRRAGEIVRDLQLRPGRRRSECDQRGSV